MRKLTLSILMAFSLTAHAEENKIDIEEQSVLGHQEIATLFPGEIYHQSTHRYWCSHKFYVCHRH